MIMYKYINVTLHIYCNTTSRCFRTKCERMAVAIKGDSCSKVNIFYLRSFTNVYYINVKVSMFIMSMLRLVC